MYLPRSKIGCLFLAMFCCLLVSLAAYAGEDDYEPTDEDLWNAQQAGDLDEVARIKPVLVERASEVWGRRVEEDMAPWPPPVTPPIKDDAFLRPPTWGNDVTIATGTVSGGISTDHDNLGNIYAVRCTTYAGNTHGKIDIYKSTDNGATWFRINGWQSATLDYTYPVVLTGSSGTPDKLYVFYLRSSDNGDVRVGRFTQSGTLEGYYEVKDDSDTISYFTACANVGAGNRLMVAYQREKAGTTSGVYTLLSTDLGETWGNEHYVWSDGAHPDLAYGYGGYVYMVCTDVGGSDDEIKFCKNTSYGGTPAWQDFEDLTSDGWDDDYAKVGALHSTTPTAQWVWVGYTHDYAGLGNWDMRFAYSSNAGVNWSKNHYLASESDYDEMACDLWVGRRTTYVYVNICYLSYRFVSSKLQYRNIYYAYCNTSAPTTWKTLQDVSGRWAAVNLDGRRVCQGTYGNWSAHNRGVVYAGGSILNYYGLYFDNQQWTDVEDETGEEVFPTEFALWDNYPNPFNPETKIRYFVPRACQVRLEVFNLLGQKIRTLVNEHQTVGNREVSWDGRNQAGEQVASGVYFYKLQAQDFVQTKKMVLIR